MSDFFFFFFGIIFGFWLDGSFWNQNTRGNQWLLLPPFFKINIYDFFFLGGGGFKKIIEITSISFLA